MSNDINKWVGIVRLSRDPELRQTTGGTSVVSFSGASNREYDRGGKKEEAVSYFNFVAWSKLGEIIAKYVKKGQRVGIEGRLQQRKWEDKTGQKRDAIEIVVENFQFLDGPKTGTKVAADEGVPEITHFSDDDIPF